MTTIQSKAHTDDLAPDDIELAAEELALEIQQRVDVYELTSLHLAAAVKLAMSKVTPAERNFNAIEGELVEEQLSLSIEDSCGR